MLLLPGLSTHLNPAQFYLQCTVYTRSPENTLNYIKLTYYSIQSGNLKLFWASWFSASLLNLLYEQCYLLLPFFINPPKPWKLIVRSIWFINHVPGFRWVHEPAYKVHDMAYDMVYKRPQALYPQGRPNCTSKYDMMNVCAQLFICVATQVCPLSNIRRIHAGVLSMRRGL